MADMPITQVFRPQYRNLDQEEGRLINQIKDKAEELYALLSSAKSSREQSIAKTKLEESVMWSVKSITA
jgi:hypothetical protein